MYWREGSGEEIEKGFLAFCRASNGKEWETHMRIGADLSLREKVLG